METLKIDKKTARRIYNIVPDWFKETLESTFSKEQLIGSILDRTKTFEECYELASKEALKTYHNTINSNTPIHIVAHAKIELIISVIREGFIPDFSNNSQKKWFPIFDLSSGCRFSGTDYDFTHTGTDVGSRLCLDSEKKVLHMAEHYLDLYNELLT